MLTSPQKRILTMVGIAMVTFSICWFWMYVPARKKIKGMKEELKAITGEIDAIEKMVGASAVDEERGIVVLRERLDYLDTRFPDQEEEALSLLSDYARETTVTVGALQTMPKETFGEQGQFDGRSCRRVEVSMELVGTFQNIFNYIKMLKKDLPILTTIEILNLKKRSVGSSQLDVTITLNLYLLS